MLQFLLAACTASLVLAAPVLETGTQLTYRGSIVSAADDPDNTQKSFDLTLWVLDQADGRPEVLWLVGETGRGEFPWPSRFGRAALDAGYRTPAAGPALLFDRGDATSVVPILLPLFAAEKPLAAKAEFAEGPLQFHVDKATKRGDRAAWQISVRDGFGRKRSLIVDQQSPVVLAMTERVVMGRGDEYELSLELIESQTLTPGQLQAVAQAGAAIAAVRDKLKLAERSEEITWNEEQAELLKKELPAVVELAAGTPLAALATAARRDLELQVGRNDAISALSAKFIGQKVPDFELRGTSGERLTADDLRGQVTILHFWDYRDEPLREPYGQIGYLDFLYHHRQADGVKLYGVAVSPRLAEATTRGAAERSVKKLKAFMNLSYPVLLDTGALLRQFGDPRVVGASLPLFVVVGPEGTILHYHVGPYEVHRDQGLQELNGVVSAALGKTEKK